MLRDYSLLRLGRLARMLITCDAALIRYLAWVRLRGLDFSGESCGEIGVSPGRGNCHAHSGGPRLESVLDAISIPAGSRVVDFGSGKGMALITLSRHFNSVVGVELSEKLVEVATRNIKKLGLTNIRLECADAGNFRDSLDEFSHVYMFNPFPTPVMIEVIANLRQSMKRRPRPLTIIYKHPACEDVVIQAGFVKRREFAFRHSHPFAIYTPGGGRLSPS